MVTTKSRVYVGTYAKYNNGSIKGAWLDLEDYSDKEEFLEACAELHADEDDPEFMFQDYEGIPEGMISESHIDEDVWEWLSWDDDDRELLAIYREYVDSQATLDRARDAYMGTFTSEEDWAEQYADDTGMLHEIPENLRYYFDFEAYARDCKLSGDVTFVEHEGDVWVFDNNC